MSSKPEIPQHLQDLMDGSVKPNGVSLSEWVDAFNKYSPIGENHNGAALIAYERAKQIHKHGRTIAWDVEHNGDYQLHFAASVMSNPAIEHFDYVQYCPAGWDATQWCRMCEKPYEERLIIAGALIAAEIDRVRQLHKIATEE